MDKRLNPIHLPVCKSTNIELFSLAKSGAPSGTVVFADSQSSGMGTNGRSFFSPKGSGIYMSVLLRGVDSDVLPHITPFAAVVVSRTLDELCLVKTQIKKINDIYLSGKKVCGILTKAQSTGKTADFVIVGVGINLFKPPDGFPDEISQMATYVMEKQDENLRQRVIEKIALNLLDGIDLLNKKDQIQKMYDYYNSHLINL